MKKNILYILVLFALSCQNEKSDINIIEYFDTAEFVDKEIQVLSKKNLKATKEISLNGEKETKSVIKVDSAFLYREFKLFRDANINKPALLGKYKMDTIWLINAITLKDEQGFEYVVEDKLDSKLKTRNVFIYSDDLNNIENSISVDLESSNFMHSYSKACYYKVGEFIKIEAWEKTLFQDTMFYETKITFE